MNIRFGKLEPGLERYVNATDKRSIAMHANIAWDMIDKSYSKIGGSGARGPQDVIDETDLLKLVRKNKRYVAVNCYKRTKQGSKLFCGATDGSPEGKQALIDMFKQDFELSGNDLRNRYKYRRNTYVEVSEAPEHILIDKLGCKPISNKLAGKILNKQILELIDDGIHYVRLIAGKPRTKCLVGFPIEFDSNS